MTAEQLGYAMELLLEAGALDVYFTPIQMKKNRPGTKLSVLCTLELRQQLTQLILTHTSTFGVRYQVMDREILDREFVELKTEYGLVRCKLGKLQGKVQKAVPEYEDCKRIAKEQSLPIQKVFEIVTLESKKIK